MAVMPSKVPQRTLMDRLRGWLGGEPPAHREARDEMKSARQRRLRAAEVAETWDRVEADAKRGGHLAWEDLLGPPAAECQEVDRWT